MAKYTLIASRDAFESKDSGRLFTLASDLAKEGDQVTLFLVQNGVFAARKGKQSDTLSALAKGGVEVLADAFSLRERGIAADRIAAGIKPAELDVVVDHMADGRKVIWH